MNSAQLAEWQQKYRDAVQPKVNEPVEAAWLFYRTGGFAAMGLQYVSGVASILTRARGKHMAGGLPNQFVLAATSTHVRAFECKPRGYNIKIGKELAAWDRSTLRVTAETAAINTTVTLETAEAFDPIVCSTGKDEGSLAMIRAMQAPVAVA
jgi:hypothetical protein